MKNIILSFVTGVLTTILMSQTPKPSTEPKFLVKSFMHYEDTKMQDFINENSFKGYKLISVNGAGSHSVWFIVMERK